MASGAPTNARRLSRHKTTPVSSSLPFFTAPDNLSAPAARKLETAIAEFEQRMSDTRDAPKIPELLIERKKQAYELNTLDGEHRLLDVRRQRDSLRTDG